MQCKYHPDRPAKFFCASCNAPLCKECTEEVRPGQYYCFQCAMMQSISLGSTSIKDKREKGEEKKLKKKKEWGPFQYFVIVASVLVLVMWGVIIFSGEKAPTRSIDFAKKGRVLLFMVDGAIKRYTHYEDNRYPKKLSDLIPKYLSLRKDELFHLDKLSYIMVPKGDYRLSLVETKPREMNVILSAKGIEFVQPSSQVLK